MVKNANGKRNGKASTILPWNAFCDRIRAIKVEYKATGKSELSTSKNMNNKPKRDAKEVQLNKQSYLCPVCLITVRSNFL